MMPRVKISILTFFFFLPLLLVLNHNLKYLKCQCDKSVFLPQSDYTPYGGSHHVIKPVSTQVVQAGQENQSKEVIFPRTLVHYSLNLLIQYYNALDNIIPFCLIVALIEKERPNNVISSHLKITEQILDPGNQPGLLYLVSFVFIQKHKYDK